MYFIFLCNITREREVRLISTRNQELHDFRDSLSFYGEGK